jgi:hypothetical protein
LLTVALLFKKKPFSGRKTANVAIFGPLYPPGVIEGTLRRRMIIPFASISRLEQFITILYSIRPLLSILK